MVGTILSTLLPFIFRRRSSEDRNLREQEKAKKRYQKWYADEDISTEMYFYLMEQLKTVVFYHIPREEILEFSELSSKGK